MTKFPLMLAAAKARAQHLNDADGKDLWALAAATVKECGGPASFGAERLELHNGKGEMLETAAKELAKHGYDYNRVTLNGMAATVLAFPASRRHPDVNFFCHAEAKNPDLLDWVIKQVGKDELSGRVVREWVGRWHTLHEAKRKEKIEAVKAKEAKAETLPAKRKARQELEELGTPMPKASLPAPDRRTQSQLARDSNLLDIDAEVATVTKTLRKNLAALQELGDDINPDYVDALVEHHKQAAEVAMQVVDLLSKSRKDRFAVIKGGAA